MQNLLIIRFVEQLRQSENKPEILYIYVVDKHRRLSGVVSFRELVLGYVVFLGLASLLIDYLV